MINKEKCSLKKIFVVMLTMCLVMLILFCVLIYKDNSRIVTFDVSNCKIVEDVSVNIDSIQDSDYFIINGYAYRSGEKIKTVNGYVLLYCMDNGKYFKLPTQLVSRPDVTESKNDSVDYSNSGFIARVSKSKLDFNNQGFEICYYYNHFNKKELVHSGIYMGNVSEENNE